MLWLYRSIALLILSVPCAFISSSPLRAQQQSPDTLTAFSNFIKAGNYDNANFYLSNNLLNAEQVDTSQLFFDVFMEKYSRDLVKNAGQIDTLYNYLNALDPIDLNKAMKCGPQNTNQLRQCQFAAQLFTGAGRDAITYFVDRGLDLNARLPGFVPPTVPMLVRLGSMYSLDDVNYFVSRGLVLGDESYSIQELGSYQDDHLGDNRLRLPANYLSLRDQNLLDVMVIALATHTRAQEPMEALHRERLCEFIAYAAPSFAPSFDYLEHVLQSVKEFRGANIGNMQRWNNNVYQPFPDACVSLVRNMATSHGRIEQVISRFAGEGDVETANWLISIRTGHN